MQTRSYDENSVRPSVRPSVCQTRALWQNERKWCEDFYTIRKTIYPSFLRKEWLVGATPSTWNFGSTDARWNEIADFEPIIARSASAVTRYERSLVQVHVHCPFVWLLTKNFVLLNCLSPHSVMYSISVIRKETRVCCRTVLSHSSV